MLSVHHSRAGNFSLVVPSHFRGPSWVGGHSTSRGAVVLDLLFKGEIVVTEIRNGTVFPAVADGIQILKRDKKNTGMPEL